MDHLSFRACARMVNGRCPTLFADAMIAATARLHGFTVATRNTGDFTDFAVPLLNPFTTNL